MSREVIQDFLNSTGVVGIALTNRRMRPYFYGLDAVLDRTKQALGQGVLQVVENLPEGFESFEFHFAGHVVFIYKLTHGLVLLVLTDRELKLIDYRRGITKIKYLIETDTYNTVAYFKLLLGSVTQHSLPSSNWNAVAPVATTQSQVQNRSVRQAPANPNPEAIATNSKPQTPPIAVKSSTTLDPTNRAVATNNPTQITSPTLSVSAKTDQQEYKLDEVLAALNKLSNFTTQYLGKVVVTNYWKSSRSDSSWLAEFEVDRSGQISHPKQAAIACNPEQLQQIQSWVAAYVKRCKQVIRNFDQMLEQDCLDSRQKQLLF
ncbi:MAG: hypothetical protein LH649_17400 [Pseudanabaena sp. CAN_BIN31]|nr:hypothetical protein [Pseudanabaena sp. CAN_BIN31]